MKIIIDTREKTPLSFSGVETQIQKLDVADYACVLADGHFVPIVMERKSKSDLFSTLTHQYDRFRNEIIRSQESKLRMMIIIEASLSSVMRGVKHSQRSPDSLLSQLYTLFCKYRVMPVFCKNAEEASHYIMFFYKAYEKNYYINKNDKH